MCGQGNKFGDSVLDTSVNPPLSSGLQDGVNSPLSSGLQDGEFTAEQQQSLIDALLLLQLARRETSGQARQYDEQWACTFCGARNAESLATACIKCKKEHPLRKGALELVVKVVDNILREPANKKFRRIKVEKVLPIFNYSGGTVVPILKNLGFKLVEGDKVFELSIEADITPLQQYIQRVKDFHLLQIRQAAARGETESEAALGPKLQVFMAAKEVERDQLRIHFFESWAYLMAQCVSHMLTHRDWETARQWAQNGLMHVDVTRPTYYALFSLQAGVAYENRTIGDAAANQRQADFYLRRIDPNIFRAPPCDRLNCPSCVARKLSRRSSLNG